MESLWPAERIGDVLPQADVLVLALPLNDTTRGMIDAAMLARMKPGALLVNVARGPLVVEADLVAALESKRLAGAVMDVTDPEPLPATSRLWELPGVIITPHVGGQSGWRSDNMTRLFCRNLQAMAIGPAAGELSGRQAAGLSDPRRRLSALGRAVRAVTGLCHGEDSRAETRDAGNGRSRGESTARGAIDLCRSCLDLASRFREIPIRNPCQLPSRCTAARFLQEIYFSGAKIALDGPPPAPLRWAAEQ